MEYILYTGTTYSWDAAYIHGDCVTPAEDHCCRAFVCMYNIGPYRAAPRLASPQATSLYMYIEYPYHIYQSYEVKRAEAEKRPHGEPILSALQFAPLCQLYSIYIYCKCIPTIFQLPSFSWGLQEIS